MAAPLPIRVTEGTLVPVPSDARPRWEQQPLPALRLTLVTPVQFPGAALLPVLAVLLGGQVERRRRRCAARGPWVCCLRHRLRYREAFGCRDCRADAETDDVTAWRRTEERPRSWGDCLRQGLGLPDNPCPYVSCIKHLAITVGDKVHRRRDGLRWRSIKIHFRDDDGGVDFDSMRHTCSQRVADEEAREMVSPPPGLTEISTGSGHSVESVAKVMNMSDEWVRQILKGAILSLKAETRDRETDEGSNDDGDPED